MDSLSSNDTSFAPVQSIQRSAADWLTTILSADLHCTDCGATLRLVINSIGNPELRLIKHAT